MFVYASINTAGGVFVCAEGHTASTSCTCHSVVAAGQEIPRALYRNAAETQSLLTVPGMTQYFCPKPEHIKALSM